MLVTYIDTITNIEKQLLHHCVSLAEKTLHHLAIAKFILLIARSAGEALGVMERAGVFSIAWLAEWTLTFSALCLLVHKVKRYKNSR